MVEEHGCPRGGAEARLPEVIVGWLLKSGGEVSGLKSSE